MPNLGGWEWVIIAVVALLLFGGSKLQGIGKNAGKAIREFKEETAALKAEASAVQPPAPAEPQASDIVDAEVVEPERKPGTEA
jgi:sec-independent protein translocase protein TatA